MYKAIASVGTLLLNLGEISAEHLETSKNESLNLSKPVMDDSPKLPTPVVDKSSNQNKPVVSVDVSPTTSSNVDELASLAESPLSDASAAQRQLCEALADAAADYSVESRENTNDDEFIRVGSEDSLSSSEVIDLDEESKCSIGVDSGIAVQPTSASDIHTNCHEDDTKVSDSLTNVSENEALVSDHCTKGPKNVAEKPEDKQEISENTSKFPGNEPKDSCKEQPTTRKRSTGNVDLNWSITFEQFFASVLTEPLLVEYFEEETNIEEIINTVKTEGVRDFVRDPRRSLSVE